MDQRDLRLTTSLEGSSLRVAVEQAPYSDDPPPLRDRHTMWPPRPWDAIPDHTCPGCGLVAKDGHANPNECIDALRSEIAELSGGAALKKRDRYRATSAGR